MRIAFYAPLKAPTHPVPSGDREIGRLLMAALESAGHEVRLVCRLRMWDDGSRQGRQARLLRLADRLRPRLLARLAGWQPQLWFTYHLYHKAPDSFGPEIAAALDIPYVVAEASYAAKREVGPWGDGCRVVARALGQADLVINLASRDAEGLRPLLRAGAAMVDLPPFIETAPYAAAARDRPLHRDLLSERLGLPKSGTWLVAIGMMRSGDKLHSYELLARALERLQPARPPWWLLIVGDGPRRPCVEAAFAGLQADRVRWLGRVESAALPGVCAAADLMVWPAVNEAYGVALLEAQAAGCPVVAGRVGGVPEIVADGETGLLVTPGDSEAFASGVAALLQDADRRARMARAAADRTRQRHDLRSASLSLGRVLRTCIDSR